MRNFVRMLLVVVFLVTVTVPPVLAKTNWNANSVWPPKNLHSVGLTDFAEKVKKATNGELEMVVHTGGALGFKGPDLLKAVRDGLVPVSDMLISGVAGLGKVEETDMEPGLILEDASGKVRLDYRFRVVLEGVWDKELKNVSNVLFG